MNTPIIDTDNNEVVVDGDNVVLTPVVPTSTTVAKADYLATQQQKLLDIETEDARLADSETTTQAQLDSIKAARVVQAQARSDQEALIATLTA